jgi:predicted GH43/DUF377 family glycosyl hydrolase
MYYSYRTGGAILPGIRYATSFDGIAWTKQGCSDLLSVGQANGPKTYVEWHQVQKIGSYYVLSAEGYSSPTWSGWVAYSTDPATGWKWSLANPVFNPSGLGWDANQVATPGYYQIGDNWYLFYQGATGTGDYSGLNWSIGMASLPSGLDPTAAIP